LLCVDDHVVLNFQLSHDAKCAVFENQLTTFLLNNTTNGRKVWKDGWTLNDTVTRQRNKLLDALRSGRLVTCPEDVKNYFHQQYIYDAFNDNAKRIVWDRKPVEKSLFTLTKDRTFFPPKPSQTGYEILCVSSLIVRLYVCLFVIDLKLKKP